MKRVLFAVGNDGLEKFLKDKLAAYDFTVVGSALYKEAIPTKVKETNPDVVVFSSTLDGEGSCIELIDNVRRMAEVRFVFLAGNMSKGSDLLSDLVSIGVYDILYGDRVKGTDVVNCIVNPKSYKDAVSLKVEGRKVDIPITEEASEDAPDKDISLLSSDSSDKDEIPNKGAFANLFEGSDKDVAEPDFDEDFSEDFDEDKSVKKEELPDDISNIDFSEDFDEDFSEDFEEVQDFNSDISWKQETPNAELSETPADQDLNKVVAPCPEEKTDAETETFNKNDFVFEEDTINIEETANNSEAEEDKNGDLEPIFLDEANKEVGADSEASFSRMSSYFENSLENASEKKEDFLEAFDKMEERKSYDKRANTLGSGVKLSDLVPLPTEGSGGAPHVKNNYQEEKPNLETKKYGRRKTDFDFSVRSPQEQDSVFSFNVEEEEDVPKIRVHKDKEFIVFASAKEGSGNTSVALSTASALASSGKRVCFFELDERMPTLNLWFDLEASSHKEGIEHAFFLKSDMTKLDDCIIFGAELRKTHSETMSYHAFPKTLDFVIFSKKFVLTDLVEEVIDYNKIMPLCTFLLFNKQYDYVIVDIPFDLVRPELCEIINSAGKVFFTFTQDVASVGYLSVGLRSSKFNKDLSEKTTFILNKYENTNPKVGEFKKILASSGVVKKPQLITVPNNLLPFVEAQYKGQPNAMKTSGDLSKALDKIISSI